MPAKKSKSIAELADEIKEPVSGEAPFNENPQENIRALAEAVYKDNEEEIERYTKKIFASLETYLKEGQTVEALWAYLKEQGCSTTAIMAGLLYFLKGKEEIDISEFTEFVLEAESDWKKATEKAKEATRQDSREARLAFLEELRKSYPDLPEFPT